MVLTDLKRKKKVVEEKVSSSLLLSRAIEERHSRLIAVGGLEPRITIFGINKKEEPTKMVPKKELTGHVGSITYCNFLDEVYLISGKPFN